MIYTKGSASHKTSELHNWLFVNNSLQKKNIFDDFVSALSFINVDGLLAEKYNHHPEIFNIYNKVQLTLTTFDYGVTDKNFELVKAIEGIS